MQDSADNPADRNVSLGDSAAADLLQPIMEAISRGSQEAFVVLLDRTVEAIAAELAVRPPDAEHHAEILAATYVEVWWLAGCRSSAEPDVLQWITRILHRRMLAAHQPAGPSAGLTQRRSRAELELATLLDRSIDHLWTVQAG